MSSDPLEKFFFLIPAAGVGAVCLSAGGPITGLSSLQPLLWAVGIGVLVGAFQWTRRRLSTIGGKRLAIRTHGGHGTKLAARHEGGHAAVARALGGRVGRVAIFPDGSGVTEVHMPRGASVVDEIAVDVAGAVAAGSSAGCDYGPGSDFDQMRAELAKLPAGERAAAKAAGYAKARAVCNGWWSDGGVSSIEKRLLKHGRIHL